MDAGCPGLVSWMAEICVVTEPTEVPAGPEATSIRHKTDTHTFRVLAIYVKTQKYQVLISLLAYFQSNYNLAQFNLIFREMYLIYMVDVKWNTDL